MPESDELSIGVLIWLGARTYGPPTRSFISPDPLPGVPGHPWATHPYHYAANNPVGLADPWGLSAVSIDTVQGMLDGWDRGVWDRYGGIVVGGVMIVGGVALIATGVGGIAGGMLIGATFSGGMTALSQQITNGSVNWREFAVQTFVGGLVGAAGAAAAAIRTTSTAGQLALQFGVDVGLDTGARMTARILLGQDPFDPATIIREVLTASAMGAGGAAATRLPTTWQLGGRMGMSTAIAIAARALSRGGGAFNPTTISLGLLPQAAKGVGKGMNDVLNLYKYFQYRKPDGTMGNILDDLDP